MSVNVVMTCSLQHLKTSRGPSTNTAFRFFFLNTVRRYLKFGGRTAIPLFVNIRTMFVNGPTAVFLVFERVSHNQHAKIVNVKK